MANNKTTNKAAAKKSAISWTDNAWDDYVAWQKDDPDVVQKINTLLEDCQRNPFTGLGKPEPLKGNLTGFWSRRITKEHRLVYEPWASRILPVTFGYQVLSFNWLSTGGCTGPPHLPRRMKKKNPLAGAGTIARSGGKDCSRPQHPPKGLMRILSCRPLLDP